MTEDNARTIDFLAWAREEAESSSSARLAVACAMLRHPGSVREVCEATRMDWDAVQRILDEMDGDGDIEDVGQLSPWAEFVAIEGARVLAERWEDCR